MTGRTSLPAFNDIGGSFALPKVGSQYHDSTCVATFHALLLSRNGFFWTPPIYIPHLDIRRLTIMLVPRNGLEPLISRVRGECVKPVPLTRHREFFSGNWFWKNSLLLESFLCLLLCTACKEERMIFSLSFLHIYYIRNF